MKHRHTLTLSDDEIDRPSMNSCYAIVRERQDSPSKNIQTAETALVAIDVVRAMLRNVLALAPSEKRARIQALMDNANKAFYTRHAGSNKK